MRILRRNDFTLAKTLPRGLSTVDIDGLLFHEVTQIGQSGSGPCSGTIGRDHAAFGEMTAKGGEPRGCGRGGEEARRGVCVVCEEAVCSHAHAEGDGGNGEIGRNNQPGSAAGVLREVLK